MLNATFKRLYPWNDPLSIVQEAGWTPATFWLGVENHALTGTPSPDRPACSESLYRLSYPGNFHYVGFICLH